MKKREGWHPGLRERMQAKGYTAVRLSKETYTALSVVHRWVRMPELIPVGDAIQICRMLDIPLEKIDQYFTWEGIR